MIAALVILVILSAFFSATETAFTSLNRIRLKSRADSGNKRAALTLRIAEDYDKLLSTNLIGNNIVNISASTVGTVLFTKLFLDYGPLVSTVVLTVVILVFGEISPKSMAKENAEAFAMFAAPIMRVLMTVLAPVNYLFAQWKKLLSRIFRKSEEEGITEEELITMVDQAENEGGLDQHEGQLIRSAIEFSDTTVHEILTPRVDVAAVDIDDPVEDILADDEILRHSRVPVYEDSVDNVIGILNTKHLLKAAMSDRRPDIRRLMRDPLFVHMTMTTADLLQEFRARRLHMAVVLDEYGGTMGIVTMEDVLEEIVGDIWDEKDVVETEYTKLSDTAYLADGSMQISDLFELLDVSDRDFESEYTTLGGWATEMLDRFPEVGDSFRYKNLLVTVTKIDNMRADKLRVELQSDGEEGSDEPDARKE